MHTCTLGRRTAACLALLAAALAAPAAENDSQTPAPAGANLALVAAIRPPSSPATRPSPRSTTARPRPLRRQEPRRLRQLAAHRHPMGAVRLDASPSRPAAWTSTGSTTTAACGCPRPAGCSTGTAPRSSPSPTPPGLGLAENRFNTTTFPELTTTKLRLEFDGRRRQSPPASSNGGSTTPASRPTSRPPSSAGVDRVVVLPGQTYLERHGARTTASPSPSPTLRWSKESGPGTVTFADADAAETTAQFSERRRLRAQADRRRRAVERVRHRARHRRPAAARRPTSSPVWPRRLPGHQPVLASRG